MMKLSIKRNDGAQASRFEDFDLPLQTGDTVRGALQYIRENLDDSLAFKSFCTNEHCGECGVRLDGRPVLACKQTIDAESARIEPLDKLPVVRDLVTDASETVYRMCRQLPSPEYGTAEISKEPMTEEEQTLFVAGKCHACCLCMSVCPLFDANADTVRGPAYFAGLSRYLLRAREAEKGHILTLAREHGILNCTLCGKCAKVCPQEIHITGCIRILLEHIRKEDGESFPRRLAHILDRRG